MTHKKFSSFLKLEKEIAQLQLEREIHYKNIQMNLEKITFSSIIESGLNTNKSNFYWIKKGLKLLIPLFLHRFFNKKQSQNNQ